MRTEIKYEFYLVTMSSMYHAWINGSKRYTGNMKLHLTVDLCFYTLVLFSHRFTNMVFFHMLPLHSVCPLCRGDVRNGFVEGSVSNSAAPSLWGISSVIEREREGKREKEHMLKPGSIICYLVNIAKERLLYLQWKDRIMGSFSSPSFHRSPYSQHKVRE